VVEKVYKIRVEENGMVIGFVLRDDLREGTCKEYFRSLSPSDLVSDSTPLLQTLFILRKLKGFS
jgi:hypothetical protein